MEPLPGGSGFAQYNSARGVRFAPRADSLLPLLSDGVCSPRGTTIRGVEALEANGMRHAFMEAVKATIER